MAALLAILASLLWGSADFLGGLASRKISAVPVVLLVQSAGVALLLPAALALPPAMAPGAPLLGWEALGWGVGAGLANLAGLTLLYAALSIGRMSVVAPITATCAIVLPTLVGLSLGERPGGTALAGVTLALVAVVLIGQEGSPDDGDRAGRRPILMALGSGIGFAAFYLCLRNAGNGSGLWPLVVARGTAVLLLAGAAPPLLRAARHGAHLRPALAWGTAAGVVDAGANILAFFALQQGPLSLVAALTSLYPASTLALARLILRERLRGIQATGLALAATAAVLIAG
ncbi:DMT family transporter [Arenibaculum pallidiluteum]|uniref:DMT family transporter n=1 Tax=Arenibaculum pallidiluteum TaxID=2812559 RepID=UPI001A963B90|nr:DMT family transporter [Arenibaculum pallidiluteum]